MSTTYPTTKQSIPNPVSTDLLENADATLDHDYQHSTLNDTIEALQDKVGIDGSAVTTTHDYKLSAVTGSEKALTSGTSTQSVTGLTLVTPALTLGSDATGDMYYRNSGGVLTRLPAGTDGQIISYSSGIPTTIANPAAADASTTVKGVVEEATQAEVNAGTAVGDTGARLFVNPSTLASSLLNNTILFGDGSDGDVVISSNTTLTRDMYYDDLTIDATFTLSTGGFRIFVKGTLTNNGTIANNGGNGGNGGNASASTGGTAGSAGTVGASTTVVAGSAGTAGTAGVAINAGSSGSTSSSARTNSIGAIGGIGGVGGTATGNGTNNGGAVAPAGAITTSASSVKSGVDALTQSNIVGVFQLGSGGTGGTGGGASNSSGGNNAGGGGGGGGGAGGLVIIVAKQLAGTGALNAIGGNGGNGGNAFVGTGNSGAGGGGTGGGGAGGVILLISLTKTNPYTTSVVGGSTGATVGTGATSGSGFTGSNGALGTNGTAGTVFFII